MEEPLIDFGGVILVMGMCTLHTCVGERENNAAFVVSERPLHNAHHATMQMYLPFFIVMISPDFTTDVLCVLYVKH